MTLVIILLFLILLCLLPRAVWSVIGFIIIVSIFAAIPDKTPSAPSATASTGRGYHTGPDGKLALDRNYHWVNHDDKDDMRTYYDSGSYKGSDGLFVLNRGCHWVHPDNEDDFHTYCTGSSTPPAPTTTAASTPSASPLSGGTPNAPVVSSAGGGNRTGPLDPTGTKGEYGRVVSDSDGWPTGVPRGGSFSDSHYVGNPSYVVHGHQYDIGRDGMPSPQRGQPGWHGPLQGQPR